MNLNIFIALLFTLFAGGYSLNCYQCSNMTGSCVGLQETCLANFTTCASETAVLTIGNITTTTQSKGCFFQQLCVNGSVNIGVLRSAMSMQCCNTDLCNSQAVPDSSSITPNGKQCYYCDGNSCLNKLNCAGTEDYCVKATANITSLPPTVKGCISKSFCDVMSQVPLGLVNVSCCQGNLCNSAKSITQNFFFFMWPFICHIMFH